MTAKGGLALRVLPMALVLLAGAGCRSRPATAGSYPTTGASGSSAAQATDSGDVSVLKMAALHNTSGRCGDSAIQFVDNAVGWVSCYDGALWRTNDGGRNWDAMNKAGGVLKGLRDFDFVGPSTGWAVVRNKVMRTDDSGYTWVDSGVELTNEEISSIRFLPGGVRGWFGGGRYQAIKPGSGEGLPMGTRTWEKCPGGSSTEPPMGAERGAWSILAAISTQ
jgi:hypothetical protein